VTTTETVRSEHDAAWSLCEVSFRRGYRTGVFIAVSRDDPTEVLAESPRFRWRHGTPTPPELPESLECLAALERELTAAGWEAIDLQRGSWWSLQFRRPSVPLKNRLSGYGVAADDDLVAWLTKQATVAAATDKIFGEEPTSEDAIRATVMLREAMRVEAERKEAERREAALLAAERREAARLDTERRETERLEATQRGAERREAERLEAERLEAERLEAERLESERRTIELAARNALHGRLSAYTATGESHLEIRSAFEKKPAVRVRRRFSQ
jgi:hypothetical protein